MKVLLLSGKQGSGKSTLARMVREWLVEKHRRALVMKFADPLYEMHDAVHKVLTKYREPHNGFDRKLIQMLGTEWGRERSENMWCEIAARRVKDLVGLVECIVIDDMRFPNEFEAIDCIRGVERVVKVRLHAPEHVRKARSDRWGGSIHASETALDHMENNFDARLDTSDCHQSVATLFLLQQLGYKC